MVELKKQIEQISGFKILNTYTKDVNFIKKKIIQSYKKTLKNNNIKSVKIENYHHLKIDDRLHAKIWTRKARSVDKNLTNYIKKSRLFKYLEKEFGKLEFSQKVIKNKPDIFWRIVRPKKKNDVGSIHADEWFWKANKWKMPTKNHSCLKVWFLLSNNLKKGLSIIPNSHKKRDWVYKKIYKDKIFKPVFDKKKNSYKLNSLITPKGKILIFNYRLLHAGLINTSNITRVSLEFTLYYK